MPSFRNTASGSGNTSSFFQDTTSASSTAGSVVLDGGNLIKESVYITGDLTVAGTQTSLNTQNSQISDTLFELNSGLAAANTNDVGFIFERGTTGDNACFVWDESEDAFAIGTTTATGSSTGDISMTYRPLRVAAPSHANDAVTKAYADAIGASGVASIFIGDGTLTETISGADTINFRGAANQTTATVSSPDTITYGLEDDVTITTSVTVPTVNTSNASLTTSTQSVSTTTQTAIDTFAHATYSTAEYTVQITQGSDIHSQKFLVVSDGTDAFITGYGTIVSNGNLGTFTADVSGSDCRFLVTMNSADAATIKLIRHTIDA